MQPIYHSDIAKVCHWSLIFNENRARPLKPESSNNNLILLGYFEKPGRESLLRTVRLGTLAAATTLGTKTKGASKDHEAN